MREKFGVSREAIAAQKESAFINRRGGNGVNLAGGAQLDCRLDVTSRSLSRQT